MKETLHALCGRRALKGLAQALAKQYELTYVKPFGTLQKMGQHGKTKLSQKVGFGPVSELSPLKIPDVWLGHLHRPRLFRGPMSSVLSARPWAGWAWMAPGRVVGRIPEVSDSTYPYCQKNLNQNGTWRRVTCSSGFLHIDMETKRGSHRRFLSEECGSWAPG